MKKQADVYHAIIQMLLKARELEKLVLLSANQNDAETAAIIVGEYVAYCEQLVADTLS